MLKAKDAARKKKEAERRAKAAHDLTSAQNQGKPNTTDWLIGHNKLFFMALMIGSRHSVLFLCRAQSTLLSGLLHFAPPMS